jgi:hypothetical protein
MHPKFDVDNIILGGISMDEGKKTMYVQMVGAARHMCFIKDPDGMDHTSQKIYFRISRTSSTIEQRCYGCKDKGNKVGIKHAIDISSINKIMQP